MPDLELLILAVIAIVILTRLYAVLGRRTGNTDMPSNAIGRRVDNRDRPAPAPKSSSIAYDGPGVEALCTIADLEKSFSVSDFLIGAREAYNMVVTAFADKDKDALKEMVTGDVFDAYADQIDARDDTEQVFRLTRLKSADIQNADLSDNKTASIAVLFGAELRFGRARKDVSEIWTFCKTLGDPDPNWRLAEVDVAH